jgi:hypothetical protein
VSDRAPVYVYGVVGAGAAVPDRAGIDAQPLRIIVAQAVAAVVSDIPGGELSFGREALTSHSDVLESVLEATTVLPMRFGVVMDDDDAVREQLLEPHLAELLAQLQRLSGRVELTLRATYEEAPLLREIVAEEPQIREFQAASRGTYLDQIRLGEMIAAAVEQRRRRDADQIMQLLVPLAEDFQLSEPQHERMALSASFLLPREKMARFDAAVDEVGRRQQDRMRLRYTGPLPPHSFVTLEQAS